MRLHKPNSDVNKAYTYKNAASALLSFSYVKNKAYMTGQTAPGGDFPATGRTRLVASPHTQACSAGVLHGRRSERAPSPPGFSIWFFKATI